MALAASRPTVDTTSGGVKLAENAAAATGGGDDWASKRFLLKNLTATAAIFLGPSGVTAANGFQWDPGDGPLEFELEPGEAIYGIVSSASQVVHSLGQGR